VDRRDSQPSTLGDVLSASNTQVLVSENTWVGLVQSIAESDQLALHALYSQTQGVVFTWIMRLVSNWDSAEELTLEVFHDVWRRASTYDPADGSVVGWIMNQARSRPIDRLRFDGAFVSWHTDVLRPTESLWDRLAQRIAAETGQARVLPAPQPRAEADWEQAAPGLSYKVLAADTEKDRVSLLVRLAPGAHYPPHRHAGVEELYLLDGELWIDDKRLFPGDYNRAEAGTADQRVWSETGCACLLLTSTRDVLTTATQTPAQSIRGTSITSPHIGGGVVRDKFRSFLEGLSALSTRGGYCLSCLSEMYSESALNVSRYLNEIGISSRQAACANCYERRETFRSDLTP
jgi:DNA-directed RNA polymerase specialized sigma24 family protein